ncbi:hypothetical protein CPT_Mokit_230 [Acinetobacter phage Mokit]|nr:hypothetical protein CPT_Mokit_230 [Acinetobacter phage Mokit]
MDLPHWYTSLPPTKLLHYLHSAGPHLYISCLTFLIQRRK